VVRTTIYPEVKVPKRWKEFHQDILLEPYTGDLPKADPMPSEEDQQKARAMLAHNIRRGKLIEKLLDEATLTVPRLFIESELEKIMGQMREDVGRMGMQFSDYLRQVNKTEEGVRNEFRQQAAKRAKLQLLLNKMAEEEKVEAEPEAIEAEMGHALEHFPDAKPGLLRIHIESVLRNEKVLKMLEGEK
jgi:trigger factor